jgi:hypothetical protein
MILGSFPHKFKVPSDVIISAATVMMASGSKGAPVAVKAKLRQSCLYDFLRRSSNRYDISTLKTHD